VESSFDVNALVEVLGQVLHTAEPIHMRARITHKPPATGEAYVNAFVTAAGSPPANPCTVPDNGSGTVSLPPVGCDYLSPDQVHMIIDGLPAGTTIELAPIHRDFLCNREPGVNSPCTNNCFISPEAPLDVDCDPSNGEIEAFSSTLAFQLTGTGTLAGYNRTVGIPNVFCKVHSMPRTPGMPVQSFDTDMMQLQGQIVGDPDFDLLRVTAGTSFGLPSPGHTTLTRQGTGWAVDSFFDITYRIDFVGAPGGPLAGRLGSTTGTIRMHTGTPTPPGGVELLDPNNNPTGIQLTREVHVPNPEKEVDDFSYSLAKIVLRYPDGSTEQVVLAGPAQATVCIPPNGQAADTDGDGRDQVPTQLTGLMLQGNSTHGPVIVMLDPSQSSDGEIEEQVNNTPGKLDLPPFTATGAADTYFDVAAKITVGGQTYFPVTRLRIQAVITHKPPAPGETYMNLIGTIAPAPPGGCTVPDNGTGTVTLPPAGCDYLSPDEVHMIIDGLPAGTTIELAPIHRDFLCHRDSGANSPCTNNCFISPEVPLDVDCDPSNGEIEQFDSTLAFQLTGTGTLAGYNRTLAIPGVACKVHSMPRTPGMPVQSFDTDMMQLQGQITGDPDFDLLRVTAGTGFGLPSPGHTTLTRLPGGNWNVDSFFDITYRIDFVGAPGGPLAGRSGSTTGTIRMQAGGPPPNACPDGVELRDANGNPTGICLISEMHTPVIEKEIDYFPNSEAEITVRLPDNTLETVKLVGPTRVVVCVPPNGLAADTDFDGLEQVPTEMTLLDLRGTSSRFGPVQVRNSPTRRILGEIEESLNLTMGILNVPPFAPGNANSSFAVYVEVLVAGQVLHNRDPIPMQARITHKPPRPGETYENPFAQPVRLYDVNGNPTEIYIVREVHTPIPPPRPCPPLEISLTPNGQVVICWPLQGNEDCVLQCTRTLGRPGHEEEDIVWGPPTNILQTYQTPDGRICVVLERTSRTAFYRLCKSVSQP
jgi:hypothetical protein